MQLIQESHYFSLFRFVTKENANHLQYIHYQLIVYTSIDSLSILEYQQSSLIINASPRLTFNSKTSVQIHNGRISCFPVISFLFCAFPSYVYSSISLMLFSLILLPLNAFRNHFLPHLFIFLFSIYAFCKTNTK